MILVYLLKVNDFSEDCDKKLIFSEVTTVISGHGNPNRN